jgi:hypothetical protein
VKAALTGRTLIRKGRIWIARLRIDHVVIFQASAPRVSSAAAGLAAAIASVAVVDLMAVIASVAAADLEDSAVVDSEVAASAAVVALAASAAAVGAGGKN